MIFLILGLIAAFYSLSLPQAKTSVLKNSRGLKISHIPSGSLLEKIKLKKGDRVLLLNGRPIHSQKELYRKLSSIVKTETQFSLKLKRGKDRLLISYRRSPTKKRKVFVSQVKTLKRKPFKKKALRQVANQGKPTSFKKSGAVKPRSQKKISNKKTLVPKKYKPHLQKAYVASLNSFVYKKPDFDSEKLFPLLVGRQVLISKKVFRPPHNFGSFYKVLIFHEKKILGYISTAEVIPEFVRQGKGYKPHPAYKVAKKQLATEGSLDIDLIDRVGQKKQKEEEPQDLEKKSKNNQRYIGPSLNFFTSSFYPLDKRKIHLGLKLSGYETLISYLNMDLNLSGSIALRHFYFDVLLAYPLFKSSSYHFLAMGGFYTDLDMERGHDHVDYGFPIALSLAIPIYRSFLFKLEFKAQYGLRKGSFIYGPASALQVRF